MQLVVNPESPVVTVQSIDAAVWQSGEHWHFRYLVEGSSDLIVPDLVSAERVDGLWRSTCFEAFVGQRGSSYLEFNFSPSAQWAAYHFDDRRAGMRDEPAEVETWLEAGEDWLAVEAAVHCAALTPGLSLGLSAVIEETGGRKSYWALSHSPGPPDFHDRACFKALLANIAHE